MSAFHKNFRQLVRRSAHWVLALWVIAWAGAILNPCCNLLAELAEHHSDANQAQVAHQHDTAYPHEQGEPYPTGACGSHSAPDSYVSSSVGPTNYPRASQSEAWVGIVVFLLAASGMLPWQRLTYHGPPRNDSSFHLITSRLLI